MVVVGTADGRKLGTTVEGSRVGSSLGNTVVGLTEGASVGSTDGDSVEATVGDTLIDGVTVGEGEMFGLDCEGATVGAVGT